MQAVGSVKRAVLGHLHTQSSPWAKRFATKTTSVSHSYEQSGTSSCEQSICLFLFLLSSVFRPRHWTKGGLNCKLSLYFSTCGQYLGYLKKTQVSPVVSCFAGHIEGTPAVEGSNYETLKMKTSLGKDTTLQVGQTKLSPSQK